LILIILLIIIFRNFIIKCSNIKFDLAGYFRVGGINILYACLILFLAYSSFSFCFCFCKIFIVIASSVVECFPIFLIPLFVLKLFVILGQFHVGAVEEGGTRALEVTFIDHFFIIFNHFAFHFYPLEFAPSATLSALDVTDVEVVDFVHIATASSGCTAFAPGIEFEHRFVQRARIAALDVGYVHTVVATHFVDGAFADAAYHLALVYFVVVFVSDHLSRVQWVLAFVQLLLVHFFNIDVFVGAVDRIVLSGLSSFNVTCIKYLAGHYILFVEFVVVSRNVADVHCVPDELEFDLFGLRHNRQVLVGTQGVAFAF